MEQSRWGYGSAAGHLVCVFGVKRERESFGGRETMIDFECPGVRRPLDTQREIIVSGTPARPPIIPFLGYEHI